MSTQGANRVDNFFYPRYNRDMKESVKSIVLRALTDACGSCVSGGELASGAAVSRNAVWKAVKSLRVEGYDISARPNAGYVLKESPDILSPEGISAYLGDCPVNYNIIVKKETASTNTDAKRLAAEGAPEGTVIAAERQTAGRGRLGKSFYSPEKSGVYLSVIMRPEVSYSEAEYLTVIAALAVCDAIESVFGAKTGIKWVNDIFIGGKKCAGILTEAANDLESGRLEYAVIGIGVNLAVPKDGFPEEIRDIACGVCGSEIHGGRSLFTAELLKRFADYYAAFDIKSNVEKYREKSVIIGCPITVIKPDGGREATAEGIDDRCRLIVRYPDGEREALSSGEVRICRQ